MKLWIVSSGSNQSRVIEQKPDDNCLRRRRSTIRSSSASSPTLSSSSQSDQGLSLSLSFSLYLISLSQWSISRLPFLFNSIVKL